MKKIRAVGLVLCILIAGTLAADDMVIGRRFFVPGAYAGQSCADSGYVSYCYDCPEDKTCEPVKGIADICYTCRDKRRCKDLGFLDRSACDNCAGKDPKMTCGPKGRDEDGKPCFECRPKRENEFDCAYYRLPSQCPSCQPSQICKPVKRQAGSATITCYECQSRRSCRNQGLMIEGDCPFCVRDPRMICAKIEKDDFEHQCFECREKKEKEIDCAYYGMPKDCSACPPDKFCEPVKKEADGNLITCYQYRDKRHCDGMGLLSKAQCPTCIDTPTNICAPTGTDEFGEPCFECRRKKGSEIDCVYYGLMSQCSACSKDAKCEPVVKVTEAGKITCYQCREKRNCRDKGFMGKEACASCADDPHKKCISRDNDDFGNACFECIEKKGKDIDCAYYKLESQCSACPKGWKCEPVDRQAGDRKITCYECKSRKSCKDKELLTEGECADCRNDPDKMCVPNGKDEWGHRCFKCVKKRKCYDIGELDQKACAACTRQDPSMRCVKASMAETGEQCYKCTKKTCDMYGLKSKCSACGEGVRCETVIKKDRGFTMTCYSCEKMRRCHDLGFLNESECTSCLDNPSNMCVPRGPSDTGATCFECRKKEGNDIDCAYYGLPKSCDGCPKGQMCEPVAKEAGDKQITCYQCRAKRSCVELGLLTANDCASCIDDPSKTCAPKGSDDSGNACYECRERTPAEQCTYYLAFADCSQCKENENCVDAGFKEITCYKCKPKTRIIRITYVILIIERTYVRVVLEGTGAALAGLGDFVPSSVMALAQVDSADAGTEKTAVGGTQEKISAGSLEDIVGVLVKKLGSAKTPYDRYGFDDFKEYALPQTLPSADASGSANSFGTDGKENITSYGPVIACGKKDGKDMVAVFDAHGTLVKAMAKDAVIQNPGLLTDAIIAAEEASKKYADQKGPQAPQGAISSGMSAPSAAATEGPLDPNDPLYLADAAKIRHEEFKPSMGSFMRIGGVELGGGNEGKKDSQVHDQWGLREIGFTPKSDPQSAWNSVDTGKKNVLVALIDSGLDMTHPDGPAYIWTNSGEVADNGLDDDADDYIDDVHGWNFLNNNNQLTDQRGHGTFVAGIIAAKANNGIGIAGINPGAEIMPLKVANQYGNTNSFHIFRAVNYAVSKGARIINISLGGRGISKLEQLAIDNATTRGVLVVVASGNEGGYLGEYGPAGAKGVITVGAINFGGKWSTISGWGPNNALMAPGEKIYSLYSKDSKWTGGAADRERLYYKASGTSFSAPMVSATASLLLAQRPQLTNRQLEDILLNSATDMETKGWDDKTGAGKLNASAALRYANDDFLTVAINTIRFNGDGSKVDSVDVFVTVRGNVDHFIAELGEGKRPTNWIKVAGPVTKQADHDWIARIGNDSLRRSRDWVIRVTAQNKQGNTKTAQTDVTLK